MVKPVTKAAQNEGAWRLAWYTGSSFYQYRILFTLNLPVCTKFSPKVVVVAF